MSLTSARAVAFLATQVPVALFAFAPEKKWAVVRVGGWRIAVFVSRIGGS